MKKSKILFVLPFALLLLLTSCQQEQPQKQYFEASPEIEIAKSAIKAYLDGDMDAFRAHYADSAIVWHNEYFLKYPGRSIDAHVEGLKTSIPAFEYYYYEGDMWEMVINDKGGKWVHFYGNWVAKYKEADEEFDIVVHIAFGVSNGKIHSEAGFWDNQKFDLAQQKLDIEE